jgi:hypothetical protein
VLTFVVALGCAAIILAPVLPPDRALAGRDLPHLFYPLGKIVASAARSGVLLPHRDPTRGLGIPLIPDMLAESFYPPRLLRAVLPSPAGSKPSSA